MQLLFNFQRMSIAESLMLLSIGLHFSAVKAGSAEQQHIHLIRQKQYLDTTAVITTGKHPKAV
jgi:hypothetical protein